MQNGFGPQSVYNLKELVDRDVFVNLRKLIIKDCNYVTLAPEKGKNNRDA